MCRLFFMPERGKRPEAAADGGVFLDVYHHAVGWGLVELFSVCKVILRRESAELPAGEDYLSVSAAERIQLECARRE